MGISSRAMSAARALGHVRGAGRSLHFEHLNLSSRAHPMERRAEAKEQEEKEEEEVV